jgi:rod shape determining protein RodA
MDWVLTLAMVALTALGLTFIKSACEAAEEGSPQSLPVRQMVWIAVGLAAYFSAAVINYREIAHWALWGYALALALLIVVLLVGPRIYGARRWLFVMGIGIQPSELAKLTTLVLLASLLSFPGLEIRSAQAILLSFAMVAAPTLLIVKEPDLGTAMVFVPAAMAIMFMAGVPARALLSVVVCGLLMVALMIGAALLPERLGLGRETKHRIWKLTGLAEYQRARIQVFLRPGHDPLGAGWSRRQSQIAVGSGGMWGKGLKKGTQNILGFLPRSVAHTDFIFSVIGEEKGFAGAVAVLGLYAVLFWRCARAAIAAEDSLGRLLCGGILVMLFFHVFTNIGMTIGIMPVTGLPLPLISYGGSFMVTTMASLGIVQSVVVRSRPPDRGVLDRHLPTRSDVLR